MLNASDASNHIVDQIVGYAESRIAKEDLKLFQKFIRLYFSQMPTEDLVSRPIADLYGGVYSHWELTRQRKPGEIKLRIFNPTNEQEGWQSTHTIIQLIMDDMPFIVDSMHMEINRLNLTTHLMIFCGGFKAKRNPDSDELEAIYSYHSSHENNCLAEAPVQMEIDRQTDAKVLSEIKRNLMRVLQDVRCTVEDWPLMCEKLQECIDELDPTQMVQDDERVVETKEFLQWLLNNHFTFLGYRDYECIGTDKDRALRLISRSGLGVLRDDTKSKMLRQYSELPAKARELALSKDQILIISKTNTMSTVHRSAYTDYVGVKRFNAKGELIGERRFIGLYTSEAYQMDPRHIPFIRRKVASILTLSKLPHNSHAGKDLMHIIATLPRDDLFHATIPELYRISIGVLQLQERRRNRLFVRKDAFGRFMSCLFYLPRDNLDTAHIPLLEKILMDVFHGLDIANATYVGESVLARVHFVVRVNPRRRLHYDETELEKQMTEITQSWQDGLYHQVLEYFGEERGSALISRYRLAFPAGYREAFSPRLAVFDIEHIEEVKLTGQLSMSFYRPLGAAKDVIRFKLYHKDHTVPLSDAVPILENMGLRVIGEQPYQIILQEGGHQVWINDFSMTFKAEISFEVELVRDIFQDAFQRIWSGDAENDPFNRLVLDAQLTWREISILRSYTKYFRQMGIAFSEAYIANTLINNFKLAKLLIELFSARFDPEINKNTVHQKELTDKIIAEIDSEIDKVLILDEDRILRRYLNLIQATLRTNFYQRDENNQQKSYLSFKLDSRKIPELPKPHPLYEIYVYSPRFEGVHLRAAKIARGGIRWSDRREDFRTEILGLMKAQQVKNALIVPAGAKGGFVPKCLPTDASREAILSEGIACYENFIRGLLDVTDNLVESEICQDINTVCYDDFDPYIVVAADKGTATFSDIANRIAIERGYWLGDAFASGGSTGYDHKKMAITARGAWVSAERHFQDLDINVDNTEISVVAIGDMSGDVFGNGMLMSPLIRLVAAFNHVHIFLDPNPNPSVSFAERRRLFEMPRSAWDDYNRELISTGGGVYSRFSKSIEITPEVKALLGIEESRLEPNELIKAILKAPVDLIWNGGIGTYVKSSTEFDYEVGDRSNDAVRINGNELKVRVVCEGGNLGITQLGRVEYELSGGKVNTDFIDNSGGVDCSDHEVNIKILLNHLVSSGDMTVKQRNELLAKMSDEVSDLVLQDNYQQNRVISLSSYYSANMLDLLMQFTEEQERRGNLDRELEFLPDDKIIMERRAKGLGLTRPELAVLLAYSKNILKAEIKKSTLMNDPYLERIVVNAFPTALNRYKDLMKTHYLAQDIIATQISNLIVSDMGIAFVYQMQDETGVSVEEIVRAYAAAREIFNLGTFNADIESLDYQVNANLQYRMMYQGVRVVRRAVRWFLRNRRDKLDISENIAFFSQHVAEIMQRMPKLILGTNKEYFDHQVMDLVAQNVPEEVAIKVASSAGIYHALNIIEAASHQHVDVFRVAKIYFMVMDRFDLLWFRDQINNYPVTSHWSVLAKAAYKGDLDWAQRAMTVGVLRSEGKSIPGKVKAWLERHQGAIERWKSISYDVRNAESLDFAILFVALRELIDLAELGMKQEQPEVIEGGRGDVRREGGRRSDGM